MPVSGSIPCEKAAQLHVFHHKNDSEPPFQVSGGWLWQCYQCHQIRQLSLQREKVSSDASAVEPFKKELRELIEREHLTLEQLQNCEEMRLYYRMLPAKIRASRLEREASAMKKMKKCVMLMTCSNATGMHKLLLVVIGKCANPRCYKNVNKKALPVHYCLQKNAWMESKIFSDWFHHQFFPAVTKYLKKCLVVKALSLLDNAPSHPNAATLVSKDGNITAFFVPPYTTSLF